MDHSELPIFDWHPPVKVIVFPMARRIGRIREVATKMLCKSTDRSASIYRDQVTDALLRSFERAGLPEQERSDQIGAFWQAVQAEMTRMNYCGWRPGGAA